MGPTLASHIGFNRFNPKTDKFIGGFISWFCLLAVVLPFSIPPFLDWFNDNTPYIKEIEYAYETESNIFERDP